MYVYIYIYMSGGQNYLRPSMDMAKVSGPLSVVKVCKCENRVSVSGWSPIGSEVVKVFEFDIPSPLPTTLVFR